MITYSAPASFNIAALISPVKAPSRSQCRFCPATADVRVARRFRDRMQRGERRRDDDLDVVDVLDHRAEFLREHDRFVHGLEHLPVGGNEWYSHVRILGITIRESGSRELPSRECS